MKTNPCVVGTHRQKMSPNEHNPDFQRATARFRGSGPAISSEHFASGSDPRRFRFAYLAAVAGDLDRLCTVPMRFFANPIGPALLLREGKFRGFKPACQAFANLFLSPSRFRGNSIGSRKLAPDHRSD